jgi:acetyltransferase-like isoleucine patch superfamily enzyme
MKLNLILKIFHYLRVIKFLLVTKHLSREVGNKSYIDYRGSTRLSWDSIILGNNVKISHSPRIEAIHEWCGLNFFPMIKIGDETTIEQNIHIAACGQLEIGKGCVISSMVLITDIEHVFSDFKSAQKTELTLKSTKIGDYVFVGAGAKILAGANIGDNCIIGANSVVLEGEYENNTTLVGVPARRLIKKIN